MCAGGCGTQMCVGCVVRKSNVCRCLVWKSNVCRCVVRNSDVL